MAGIRLAWLRRVTRYQSPTSTILTSPPQAHAALLASCVFLTALVAAASPRTQPRITVTGELAARRDVVRRTRNTIRRIDRAVERHLPRPDTVRVVLLGKADAARQLHDGTIELPHVLEVGGHVAPRSAMSVILAHEYGHTLFSTFVEQRNALAREYAALGKELVAAQHSSDLVGSTPRLQMIRRRMVDSPMRVWDPHHELAADLVAVLDARDPSAVRRALDFLRPLSGRVLGGIHPEMRDFASRERYNEYQLMDAHDAFAPARAFIGRHVLPKERGPAGRTLSTVFSLLAEDIAHRQAAASAPDFIWRGNVIGANQLLIEALADAFGVPPTCTAIEQFVD